MIVPDLLGFGLTDKPQDVEDYAFTALMNDVSSILTALKAPKTLAAIVAHDYGTTIGTALAAFNGVDFNSFPCLVDPVNCEGAFMTINWCVSEGALTGTICFGRYI